MRFWVLLSISLAHVSALQAQWTLPEVVQRAGEKYAGVQVSLEQAAVAAAAVQQAHIAFLPKGDFYAQLNRATRNNVFGMLMPNSSIPPISGPVQTANAGTNVWGSATGFLVQWEPFDLGQRSARVSTADAGRVRAERAYARTRFEVEAGAADSFLTILAADETVKNAKAGVDRASSLATVAGALARAGLRPEADAARAQAELAAAEAQAIQAEQAARLARIAVAQLTGSRWEEVKPQAPFTARQPGSIPTTLDTHPALREQEAALKEAELRKHEADIAWRPRFNTQTALYARGSGDAAQIGPHFYNWGIGFSVLFPFLDLPAIRAQQQSDKHKALTESARLAKVTTDLNADLDRARAALDAAQRIARTTPVQLAAARTAHEQARARYQSGLASIVEVAEAQRLLLASEIDDSLARLNIWRAQLAVAAATGDLLPFLEHTK